MSAWVGVLVLVHGWGAGGEEVTCGPISHLRCDELLTCAAGADAAPGLLVVVVTLVVVVVGKVQAAGAGAVVADTVALAPFIVIAPSSALLDSMMDEACRGRRTGMGQALTPPLSSEAMACVRCVV